MSTDRTDAVLAAIDGALADDEFPDAMRWSPAPETVTDAGQVPFDGDAVPLPPQSYERGASSTWDVEHDYDPALPIGPRNFPLVSTRRGGIRFPRPAPSASAPARPSPPFLFAAMEEALSEHRPAPAVDWSAVIADLGRAWAEAADRMHTMLRDASKAWLRARGVLEDAGVLEPEPPTDVRERALQARRHRGTGPDRQVQHQRRPRRLP